MNNRFASILLLFSLLAAMLVFNLNQSVVHADEVITEPPTVGKSSGSQFELTLSDGQISASELDQESPDALVESAFTYQGLINKNGTPYQGTCDILWLIYDASTEGTQIDIDLDESVPVVNGLFSEMVNIYYLTLNGTARWLEVRVRCPAGSGDYVAFSPRQALAATPYALGLRLPLTHSVNDASTLFSLTNPSTTTNSATIYASNAGASGVWGNSYGGTDAENGVLGTTNSTLTTNAGVKGTSSSVASGGYFTSASGYGIYGSTSSTSVDSASVRGESTNAAYGGYFSSSSGSGVYATTNSPTKFGGYFNNTSAYLSGGALYANGDAKQNLAGNGFIKAGAVVMCSNVDSYMGGYFNNVNTNSIYVTEGTLEGDCTVDFGFNVSTRYIIASVNQLDYVVFYSLDVTGYKATFHLRDDYYSANGWITILVY